MLIRVELFLLVIKGIILNNVQSSNHKGVISVYSGEYILESQEILLEKYGFNSHLDEKSFRLSGKLCSFDQNNDIFKQCFGKYELLNKRWILMISSKRHLEIVSQYLRNIDYEAVLFLKSAVNVNYTLDFIHPYFSLEADQYESFQKYDINSETENLFTYISYDQLTHEYAHMKWLNGVSLALLVIISLHFVLWVLYTHYLNRGNYTLLQRYYGTLPYMNLMLVSGVYYYVVNKINERVVLDNLFFLLVTEILIKLVKIIYKTFFWILVILVSYGFLTMNMIERRAFFFIFMIVYLGFLIDLICNQIIPVDDLFGIFDFIVLKTIVFYSFYCILIINKTRSMLRKYDLSLIRSMVQDELVKSVIMKICLIRNNCIIITIYVCLYIIGNLGLSVMLSGTKNPVAMVFNQCIDSITLVFVLYNLRGRRLLSLYDGVDIMFDEYQSIFKATIESKGLNSAEGIVSVEADKCSVLQESYIPIVVINPGFEGFRNDWDSEYTINGTLGEPRGLMSCVSIGWILQYED